jgi:signal transduction histidine kinase/CheY-like chemotaxis protein
VHGYLLFHSLTEVGTATISFAAFLFAWNTRRFQNGFFHVVGASALFVAIFGILHCLAFPGMAVFPGYGEDLSPDLWLAARTFEAGGCLAGLLAVDRKVPPRALLAGLGAAAALALAAIFAGLLPRAVKPFGLTAFKIEAEWAIAAAFLVSAVLLRRRRTRFSPRIYRLLVAYCAVMAACEICFTLYSRPDDAVNLTGHLLLIAGVTLRYRAIVRVGLLDPDAAHFREMKEAERELARARDRLERAQAAGRVGTFEWDIRADVVALTGMESVYGAAGQSIRTRADWLRRMHPEDVERVRALAAKALEGEAPFDVEYRVDWQGGPIRWVQARGKVELDADGAPARMVGVNVDVTDHKRAEALLRESDQRKSEFLAVLSHELRNPLAAIQSCLFVLGHAPEGSEPSGRARAVLARQTAQLSRLVDDLLDLTRVTQGKLRLRREPLELGELARRAAEDHAVTFTEAGLSFALEAGAGPLWVDGDATRLTQVVGNLLGNAAKFTPAGGAVRLSLAAEGDDAVLRVRDTGVGIAPEVLPRLFVPFAQADQSLDRSRGGLGLGLALVRSLVDLHGGAVRASSEGPGRGAEVEVRLPRSGPAPARMRPEAAAPPRRTILVIEDNADAADSLGEMLRLMGHDAHVERSGAGGIEAAARLRPDLVLCDIGLPDVDGFEVARRLRAHEPTRGCTLIALTGYATAEDVIRTRDAGFDRHLAKPLALEELTSLLREPAAPRSEPRPVRASGT